MRASDISRVPGVEGWQIKVTIRLNDGDVKVIGHREGRSEIAETTARAASSVEQCRDFASIVGTTGEDAVPLVPPRREITRMREGNRVRGG